MAFDLNDEELKATRDSNGANICVGDYIRIKDGYIHKVKSIYQDIIWYCDIDWISIKDIVKHSKNIIDLIEVGDYVNGHLVFDKAPDCLYMEDIDNKMAHIPIIEEDIKTIVTKEQFNSIAYRLEE